jgi:hypothetical protein
VQDRVVLTSVQVTPAAYRLMIIQRARLSTLRAVPMQPLVMAEMYVNFSLVQLQLDAFHAPRVSNSQDLGIQISILHLSIIGCRPLKCLMSRRTSMHEDCGANGNDCASG